MKWFADACFFSILFSHIQSYQLYMSLKNTVINMKALVLQREVAQDRYSWRGLVAGKPPNLC